jgi:hypothetical protein
MTVRQIDEFAIALEGVCPVADAEVLRQHLVSTKSASIDFRACERAHTAVIQVLLASEREVDGEAGSLFFEKYLVRRAFRADLVRKLSDKQENCV